MTSNTSNSQSWQSCYWIWSERKVSALESYFESFWNKRPCDHDSRIKQAFLIHITPACIARNAKILSSVLQSLRLGRPVSITEPAVFPCQRFPPALSLSPFVAIFAGECVDVSEQSTFIGLKNKVFFPPSSLKLNPSFNASLTAKITRKYQTTVEQLVVAKVEFIITIWIAVSLSFIRFRDV